MWTKWERFTFYMGWIALGLGIAGGLLLRLGAFDWMHGLDLCAFHRATGLYCPGCGITRACFSLANGRVDKSLLQHPIPIIALLLYAVWFIRMNIQAFCYRHPDADQIKGIQEKNRLFIRRFETALIIGVAILILQWLVKLALQIFWHLDWFNLVDGIL